MRSATRYCVVEMLGAAAHDGLRHPSGAGIEDDARLLRIAFVIPNLEISGGVSVAVAHATSAARAGHDIALVVSDWTSETASTIHGVPAMSLAEATGAEYDLVIANVVAGRVSLTAADCGEADPVHSGAGGSLVSARRPST